MNQTNFDFVLNKALELPLAQQQQLIRQLIKEVQSHSPDPATGERNAEDSEVNQSSRQAKEGVDSSTDLVEKTFGTIKGLDRETLISIAEDEEFCGY